MSVLAYICLDVCASLPDSPLPTPMGLRGPKRRANVRGLASYGGSRECATCPKAVGPIQGRGHNAANLLLSAGADLRRLVFPGSHTTTTDTSFDAITGRGQVSPLLGGRGLT